MPAGAGRRKRQRGITECMDEWEAGKVRLSLPIIHYFLAHGPCVVISCSNHSLSFAIVLRIHDILVRIRIRGSMPRLMDPNPAIFVIDLQDANKKQIFKTIFSAYYFLKVHLHHFSKIKSHTEVTKR
jgi:hypothetical protein